MTTDRWHLMTLQLCGQPLPPPPARTGRLYRAPRGDDTDPGLVDLQVGKLWRELARDNEKDSTS